MSLVLPDVTLTDGVAWALAAGVVGFVLGAFLIMLCASARYDADRRRIAALEDAIDHLVESTGQCSYVERVRREFTR